MACNSQHFIIRGTQNNDAIYSQWHLVLNEFIESERTEIGGL